MNPLTYYLLNYSSTLYNSCIIVLEKKKLKNCASDPMLKFLSGSVTSKISNHLAILCSGYINDATF